MGGSTEATEGKEEMAALVAREEVEAGSVATKEEVAMANAHVRHNLYSQCHSHNNYRMRLDHRHHNIRH